MLGSAKNVLQWNRISFSRLTIIYFSFSVVHFIIQLSLQITAFTINADAANFLTNIVHQANTTNNSLPFLQDGTILLAALAHCSSLETLALNFDCCRWFCTNGYGSKVITLPKLRSLKLARLQRDFKVLSFVNAPALTHLDVQVREEVKPDILSSFITQQVTRSQDALHVSLSTGDSTVSADFTFRDRRARFAGLGSASCCLTSYVRICRP